MQLAQQDVAIGDGQRPAAAIAGRPGVGTGAFRPDAQPAVLDAQHRAAASRHRVDPQHRHAHADTGDLGFLGALETSVEVRHIGRGAAHVEADQLVEPRRLARRRHADDAAGGARQDGVAAAKVPCFGKPAIRLHEQQLRRVDGSSDRLDIGPERRRQIGVRHCRQPARHQLDDGADSVAGGDLGETDLARHGGQPRLVRRPAPAVHQHDGDAAQAAVEGADQRGAGGRLVQLAQALALGAHAFVDLDDIGIERRRPADLARKDVGPRLVADQQRIAMPPGDGEQRRRALALQKRIGGNRRPHAHGGDGVGVMPAQPPDALAGGIGIAAGIAAQQLGGGQAAIGPARDDIGEGATAIDPEFPCRRGSFHGPSRGGVPRRGQAVPRYMPGFGGGSRFGHTPGHREKNHVQIQCRNR